MWVLRHTVRETNMLLLHQSLSSSDTDFEAAAVDCVNLALEILLSEELQKVILTPNVSALFSLESESLENPSIFEVLVIIIAFALDLKQTYSIEELHKICFEIWVLSLSVLVFKVTVYMLKIW